MVIRVAGVVVAAVAAVVTAFLELELSALRIGAFRTVLAGDSPYEGSGDPLPLAVPVAVLANLAIGWFAVYTTGRRRGLVVPWVLWTLVMMAAAGTRTAEGDYLVGGTNVVALVTILAGSLTFAVHSYRLILRPLRTDSEIPGAAK
ncbi:hypothetical protein MB27_40850 [Actinoplanes utahensis]|uniref:Uncharacterized protein n=1 Tax=Actinoplanes utahensis TaxID=1869 RepID=A0A0A6UA02_ACTUT|nr:hypothetical protein MB27_40850 [Actinoplanes utahensis]